MGHFTVRVDGNIKLSKFFDEAVEFIEATEVVEVIEATEVPNAREITQHVICKMSISTKMHKKAKNVGKKMKIALHLIHSNCFYRKMIFHFHQKKNTLVN